LRASADEDLAGRIQSASAGLLVHAAEVERRDGVDHQVRFLPARPAAVAG
jgi:hypothetical protein